MADRNKTPFSDREKARQAGRKGGRAKARMKLNLARVEEELGQLDTLDDAERWLRTIGIWAAAGMLAGAVASACVRSIEVWLRSFEKRSIEAEIDELREQVEALKKGKLKAL